MYDEVIKKNLLKNNQHQQNGVTY